MGGLTADINVATQTPMYRVWVVFLFLCNTRCCTLLNLRGAEADEGHYDGADNGRKKHESNVNGVAF